MKLLSSLFLLLALSGTIALASPSVIKCVEDWSCPNQPYSYCKNRLAIMQGLAMDGNGNVLFAARYNTSLDPLGHTYIFTVSIDGGAYKQQYEVTAEELNPPLYSRVNGLAGYLASIKQPILVKIEPKVRPLVGTYDPVTKVFTTLYKDVPQWESSVFDESTDTLYRCEDLAVTATTPIPKSLDDPAFNQTRVISKNTCYGLALVDDDVVFNTKNYTATGISTNFYDFPSSCQSCQAQPRFTVPFDTYAFTASSTHYFYASNSTLYARERVDSNVSVAIAYDNYIGSLLYDDVSKSIYYTTSDSIKRVTNVDSATPRVTILYNPSLRDVRGECACARGFTGDCSKCNGTVRWVNNSPLCDRFRDDGSISFCDADYQCGPVPYVYCYFNSCVTRFKPEDCVTIAWENGIPRCLEFRNEQPVK
eukprot:gene11939-13914_t